MAFTVAIADDERLARQGIRRYLSEFKDFEVIAECGSGLEAVTLVDQLKPDLLFLDIQMPQFSGFEVLKNLKNPPPAVIFTTAYDSYALEAFNASAIDYLLKPFDKGRFDASLTKAIRYLSNGNHIDLEDQISQLLKKHGAEYRRHETVQRILIKESKRIFFLKLDQICWFEASGDYVVVHTENKSHLINESLMNLEKKLDPEQFIRIHRSSMINVEYIQEFEPHFNGEFYVTLKNQTKLKLSRTYRHNVKFLFGEVS
jgi:two-component system LytT family response regulator